MTISEFDLIHSCNVLSTSQDQRLNFTAGSAIFTVGKVLTGATSHAHGTIKTVVLSSGAWSGTAAGYLILSAVSGTFGIETITDSGTIPGHATGQGPAIPETDDVGFPATTTTTTPYDCRFENIRNPGGSLYNSESGEYISAEPIVFLPDEAVVVEGDYISSSEAGYNSTYEVTFVNTLYDFFDTTIDHIEASLRVVEKRT